MRISIATRGFIAGAATVLLAGALSAGAGAVPAKARHRRPRSNATEVVVPRGEPVQIAFTADTTDVPDLTKSFENAIEMAIAQHPTIRGFAIQLNVVDQTRCGDDPNVNADDAAAAQTIVANTQNTAVLGNLCSFGFPSALAIYQAAGLVTISGSATADWVPSPSFSVFDRTVVSDGDGFSAWYAVVQGLPRDLAWQGHYAAEFGSRPQPYADLYYDATSLLLQRLQQVSVRDSAGDLVIRRAALATAVRNTNDFRGVSCTITLDPSTGNRLSDPAALERCGNQ